jgi:spore maturation protein CgeB
MAVLGLGDVGALTEVKHTKGRAFEVPMSGGLYLTTFNPELADAYIVGKEILCYTSLEECVELLNWVRRYPLQASEIRRAGLCRSLRDHTWQNRFATILSMLTVQAQVDSGS